MNFPDNNPVRITKWNNGNLQEDKCPNVSQVFKDDVKFIRKMVDTIKQTFNVNPKKIFGSGFSNGGAMVAKLAIEAPDVFAAVANVYAVKNHSSMSIILNKKEIGKGLFIVKISQGHKTVAKRIVFE